MVAIQQLLRITQSRLVVYLVTHHQITIYCYLVVAQRLQIAVLTSHNHIEMVRTTHERYLPTARLYQVLRSHICRLVAVGCHAGEPICQTRTTKKHQGDTHLGNLLKMVIVPRRLRQTGNDTLHMQSDEVVHRHRLVLHSFVTIDTEHAVPCLTSLILYAVQHGSIIMRHKVRHNDANHLRRLLTQTLGKGIRTVVQLLGQILHALLHLLADFRRTAQCTTDGCYTDTQFACQILQRSPMLFIISHSSYFTFSGFVCKVT